jgi:hypothetical protein
LRARPEDDPAINTHALGEGRMQRGLLAQLSPHERTTLRRIANGDDRSGTLNSSHVTQLLSLCLIEERVSVYCLTALGRQRIERLESW